MPFDLVRVLEAKAVGATTLWLRFSDGASGTVNLDGEFGPRFDELRDDAYLARVQPAGGGIEWPNGYDCAPEWLRERIALKGADERRNDDGWEALRRQAAGMPEISRFFGIVIRMFYSDKARPHFHARYGEHEISVEIDGDGVEGRFPASRLRMLFEWRDLHRTELLDDWALCADRKPPKAIPPLK